MNRALLKNSTLSLTRNQKSNRIKVDTVETSSKLLCRVVESTKEADKTTLISLADQLKKKEINNQRGVAEITRILKENVEQLFENG